MRYPNKISEISRPQNRAESDSYLKHAALQNENRKLLKRNGLTSTELSSTSFICLDLLTLVMEFSVYFAMKDKHTSTHTHF